MQQSSRGVPKPRQTSIWSTAASEICFESGPFVVLKDRDAQAQATYVVPYKAGDLESAVLRAGRDVVKLENFCRCDSEVRPRRDLAGLREWADKSARRRFSACGGRRLSPRSHTLRSAGSCAKQLERAQHVAADERVKGRPCRGEVLAVGSKGSPSGSRDTHGDLFGSALAHLRVARQTVSFWRASRVQPKSAQAPNAQMFCWPRMWTTSCVAATLATWTGCGIPQPAQDTQEQGAWPRKPRVPS